MTRSLWWRIFTIRSRSVPRRAISSVRSVRHPLTQSRIPVDFGEIELKRGFALSAFDDGVGLAAEDFQFEIPVDRIDLVQFVHHCFHVGQFVEHHLSCNSSKDRIAMAKCPFTHR